MSATGAYRSIILKWTNASSVDLASTEIYSGTVNDRALAMLIETQASIPGTQQRWVHTARTPGETRYYWLRHLDHYGNASTYFPVSATAGWSATASAVPPADVTLRVVALTDAATVTPDADTTDLGTLATLSQATQFNTPSGSPTNGQQLILRINSTVSRALTWQSGYRSTTGATLPIATTGSSVPDYILLRYHAGDSKWDCVAQTVSASGAGATQGKHSHWIPAAAMLPSVTNGATWATVEMSTNTNTYRLLAFAKGATKLYAEFDVAFPKKWNEGTLTFQPYWTLNSTSTNSAVWGLQAIAMSDSDALDVAFGTAQEVIDAGLGTAYDTHIGSESSAMTIAGTPAEGDLTHFRFYRDPTNGSDTLAVTVYLLGIKLFWTTNADTDA